MSALILNDYKDLFKNEASYDALIRVFHDAMANHGMPIVVSGKEVLFTAISPEATQDMLRDRIVRRLAEKPALLDAIARGLEEEVVD